MRIAKLFKNGQSMAVRLPREFRLPGNEVNIFHMGDAVVLQSINTSWLKLYGSMNELENFMETKENLLPEEREVL